MAKTKNKVASELSAADDGAAETNGQEALTPKQLALMLDTDARTVRKFLRSQKGKVGQGNRWAIDADEVDGLMQAFQEQREKLAEKAEARKAREAEVEGDSDDDEFDTDEDILELDDLE